MRPNLIDAEQYALNLGWEDVDALDDHHIIAAALHLFHPDVGAPAGTGGVVEAGDVAGAVAQKRQRLFKERGDNQLAGGARGQHLAGFGIDDLRDKMILPDVQPAAVFTFSRNAGAGQLAHPVVVGGDDAEVFLNLLAHFGGAALRTEKADPQFEIADDPLLCGNLA